MMLLALVVTALSKFGFSDQSNIMILLTAQVCFYKSERGFLEKHKRYNNVTHALKHQALFFESLNENEMRIPINLIRLVTAVETIICNEVQERFNIPKRKEQEGQHEEEEED